MKKFILNLLSVVAWIYQAFCVLSIVMSVVITGLMIFVVFQPDIRVEVQKGFRHGMSLSDSTMWWIIFGLFAFMFVGFFAQFFICHYARSIIKNIKQEIYFAVIEEVTDFSCCLCCDYNCLLHNNILQLLDSIGYE